MSDYNKYSFGCGGGTINVNDQPIVTSIDISKKEIQYKYNEDQIIADFLNYLDRTYQEHYKTNEDEGIECFDAWIALGDSSTSFRDTAIKYLWRYGKKNGLNKKDILKVMHYCVMMLYVDHYKDR